MKWTISQLQKYRNKDFPVDETVRVDEIKEVDSSIRDVSPMHITGRVDISATKVTFHLRIEGYLILPCSRTLVDVNFPVNVETTETFLLGTPEYETEEEEMHQLKGDVIDLMQVFCEDDESKDGAPQSGKDWEVIREKEKQQKVDPRLAGLAKFFEQKDS
jgi:uncharacterized protein